MAGASVTVRADDLVRALRCAERAAVDMRPAWMQVGEHMLRSIDKNFNAEGRPDRWKRPLAASTLKRKKPGKKILGASGRLRRSITRATAVRARGDGVVVGTNVVYAAIHQFGGQAGRGRKVTLPARPYLMVHDEDLGAIVDIVNDHVMGALS